MGQASRSSLYLVAGTVRKCNKKMQKFFLLQGDISYNKLLECLLIIFNVAGGIDANPISMYMQVSLHSIELHQQPRWLLMAPHWRKRKLRYQSNATVHVSSVVKVGLCTTEVESTAGCSRESLQIHDVRFWSRHLLRKQRKPCRGITGRREGGVRRGEERRLEGELGSEGGGVEGDRWRDEGRNAGCY